MNLGFENPFADYGVIVGGDRFIGCKSSLQAVENRIIRPHKPGNLAIIGEPRIGKSSLVNKAILERKEELIAKRLVPVWINVATFDHSSNLFRAFVTCCFDELEDLGWLSKPIERAATRALEDQFAWSEGYGRIQRFFQRVCQADIRIIFILDEFDHARYLFKDDISGFQGLRELAYRPEWRVTFVTTSRRTIREIEEQTQAISTFDGIFHKHYLGMFDEHDLAEYFARFDSIGLGIDSAAKKRIAFYCGGYPYLLEMLGYEIIENWRETNQLDIEQSAKLAEGSILDQYDRLVDLLKEDGELSKLLQVLFGPIIDVKQTDVENLLRYGLIRLADSDTYTAYSEHFLAYLKLIERQVDLWPIWHSTEIALRDFITMKMIEIYGGQWITKLEKARVKLKDMSEVY